MLSLAVISSISSCLLGALSNATYCSTTPEIFIALTGAVFLLISKARIVECGGTVLSSKQYCTPSQYRLTLAYWIYCSELFTNVAERKLPTISLLPSSKNRPETRAMYLSCKPFVRLSTEPFSTTTCSSSGTNGTSVGSGVGCLLPDRPLASTPISAKNAAAEITAIIIPIFLLILGIYPAVQAG